MLDRVSEKVVEDENGCWVWQGRPDAKGYGRLSIGSKLDGSTRNHLAHRVAYELFVGPIPEGLELDHLCRNTLCINPEHLEPVDHRTNCQRGRNVQREKTGCPRGHAYDGVYPNGERFCRECSRERWRRYYYRRKKATRTWRR